MENRLGNNGNSDRLYFLGLQNHCRWWLQQRNSKTLAPWKKSNDKPRQHIKKQSHYFASKGPCSQGYGFSIVIHGCESWTIKKAERHRIVTFGLWWWRRLLRVPWTAKRSNQSILRKSVLNIYSKDWCWSWSSNTLATSCKEPISWKRPWCWERLKTGGEGDDRGWDGWMVSLTQWTWVWASSGTWWWTGRPGVPVHGVSKSWTRLSDWTELNWTYISSFQRSCPPENLPPAKLIWLPS